MTHSIRNWKSHLLTLGQQDEAFTLMMSEIRGHLWEEELAEGLYMRWNPGIPQGDR